MAERNMNTVYQQDLDVVHYYVGDSLQFLKTIKTISHEKNIPHLLDNAYSDNVLIWAET